MSEEAEYIVAWTPQGEYGVLFQGDRAIRVTRIWTHYLTKKIHSRTTWDGRGEPSITACCAIRAAREIVELKRRQNDPDMVATPGLTFALMLK